MIIAVIGASEPSAEIAELAEQVGMDPYEFRLKNAFVDGAVTIPTDIDAAIELGAKQIIAIDLSPGFDERMPSNIMEVILRSYAVLAEFRSAHPEIFFAVTATTRSRRPGEIDGLVLQPADALKRRHMVGFAGHGPGSRRGQTAE